MKEGLKFVIKNIVPSMGSVLLFLFGARPNRTGWEKRILVMFGGGIGDVMKRSVVCEYVKEYLSGYDVYYLMPYDLALPNAKETVRFDYTRAKINPFYYFSLANRMRRIGFSGVIVLLPAWEGFYASLGESIRPDALYRYVETPPPEAVGRIGNAFGHMKRGRESSRDIPLISFYDDRWPEEYFPSDVYRMAYFFSQVICDMNHDARRHLDMKGLLRSEELRTELELPSDVTHAADHELAGAGPYCVIGLGSSSSAKNWPPEKFGEVATTLAQRRLSIVLTGGTESVSLVDGFRKTYAGELVDLVAKTSLPDLIAIINGAALVIGNDTSFIHIAIALRKPTICILYGNRGADSYYGYRDINHWVCHGNIAEVRSAEVIQEAKGLLARADGRGPAIPQTKFAVSFFENDYPAIFKRT